MRSPTCLFPFQAAEELLLHSRYYTAIRRSSFFLSLLLGERKETWWTTFILVYTIRVGCCCCFYLSFFFLPLSDLKVNSPRYSIEQQQQQEIERKEQVKALANKNFETTFSPLLLLHTFLHGANWTLGTYTKLTLSSLFKEIFLNIND